MTVNASGVTLASETLMARILDKDQTKQAGSAWQTALKAQQSGAMKGKCQNCSKKGHYVADCWAKGGGKKGQGPKGYRDPKSSDSAKQADDKDADYAFKADDIALVMISASDWLAVSGMSTHIVWDRRDFISYIVSALCTYFHTMLPLEHGIL